MSVRKEILCLNTNIKTAGQFSRTMWCTAPERDARIEQKYSPADWAPSAVPAHHHRAHVGVDVICRRHTIKWGGFARCCHVLPQDTRSICRGPAGRSRQGWAEPQIRTAFYKVFLSFLSSTGIGRDSLNNSAISPLKASAFLLIISRILELTLITKCKWTQCYVYATDWRQPSPSPLNHCSF